MERTIRVLHLEDDPGDAALISHKLAVEGLAWDIVHVGDKAHFEAALARESFDLVICDYNLPGYDGLTAIKRAQEQQPDVPVIVISGTVGEEMAVECLHQGATDYLLKDRLERLAPAVQRALQEATERRSRREAEQRLRESEERYRLSMDLTPDAILIVDRIGRIQLLNVATERLFGYQRAELLGRPVETLIPTRYHQVHERHRHAYDQAAQVRFMGAGPDLFGLRRDGTEVPVEVSLGPFEFADERLVICVVRDITARRQLEAQFRQAQKMQSVGQLAGGIAHDFNNLLTIINGTTELAQAQVPAGDPVWEDLQEIRRAGERAAALTRQLLAFSRKQIQQLQVIDLNTVVTEMEKMLRRLIGEDIDLVFVPTQDLGAVKVDPGQIEQVIANLAVNARDAMPRGGKLTIETHNVEIDESYARQRGVAASPGPYVILAMSDTGVGIDEVTRGQIFEPFFTTKDPGKGTGLGLSTVYGIVKQSNGLIWVYSEVGKGTTFKIYLPRAAERADAQRRSPTVSPGRGTETILIVEDVNGLRLLATRILQAAGYTVLTAVSAEEAFLSLTNYKDPVHLMVTDIVMPGMSGPNLAKGLRRTRPEMKVIYMSGYTDDAVVRHGVLDDSMPFVSKPFSTADLIRKVREVLDSQG
jgi:two-component system cell cycle sensor histidine kinase/response regulator CckA